MSTSASTASSDKKVYFDTSHNQEIAANEEHYLTDEICGNCWFSEEQRAFMKINRDADLQDCNEEEKERFSEALKQLVHFVHHAPVHYHFTQDDLRAKASTVSTTDLRGLEIEAAPLLTAMRKKHAANVLAYTERVPKRLPQDLRNRMVSARSLQYSRPHMLFAQVMAQVDRNAVLEMEETSLTGLRE